MLVIGLDGMEISYAEQLMDAGELPALRALRAQSARFLLDHGAAQHTGLAWEHVASGLSPRDGKRWSAVEFDPDTYGVHQAGARFAPVFERFDAKTTLFDAPYVDLRNAKRTQGVVGWGAHDPGTTLHGHPNDLLNDIVARFGKYPAADFLYSCPAYSSARCQEMGDALSRAAAVRRDAATWMLKQDRFRRDLFFVVTGELHSAIEGLWHGVDSLHPLHDHESAAAAEDALLKVHRSVDALVADILDAAGDDIVIAFTMGGMGSNHSDLQSMVLLPELLHRNEFGHPFIQIPDEWTNANGGIPNPGKDTGWGKACKRTFPHRPDVQRGRIARALQRLTGGKPPIANRQPGRSNLSWQPTTFYRERWPAMTAFALPSFYDGRVRINLQGRERDGIVPLAEYANTCEAVIALLSECRDPRTGQSSVSRIERSETTDPLKLDDSDADLIVVWSGPANALQHPRHGLVGPIPYRRTGGHTGRYGFTYVSGSQLEPGAHGVRSSFDVIPTIAGLLGEGSITEVSGQSLMDRT